ncbi:MAG TPA: response regulator, partial [bacterium]|nr:response regulator [bacterium]
NVHSEVGKGTTVKVYLPRCEEEAVPMKREDVEGEILGGTETILLVEDEPAILNLAQMMIERWGYRVLAASTPTEAMQLAQEHAGGIHLLITDVIMPEMNGRDLARSLHSSQPEIRTLFMSGYNADIIAHHGVLDRGVYFIQKPFMMDELAAKIREALAPDI